SPLCRCRTIYDRRPETRACRARRRSTGRGWTAKARSRSSEGLPRIKRITDGFANEDQQRKHDRNAEKSSKAKTQRLHIGLSLRQQFAERWRAGRQTEAQEIERSQRHHRRRQNERQKRHGRDHGIWKQVAENNNSVRHPESARGLDVFEIAAAQKF